MNSVQLIGELRTCEIPDSYLLVGIDETGQEKFADSKHPVFGLGGCAVRASEYDRTLRLPWQQVRVNIFPGHRGALHAADVGQLSTEHADTLGQFFRTADFARLGVVLSNRTVFETDLPPYEIVARKVLDQIARFAARRACNGVAMIIEESSRTDPLAVAFFNDYHIELQRGIERDMLPFLKFRMPKSAAEPLLEVADFIIHVAGSQVRDSLNGRDWGRRLDFQAIFPPQSNPRSEFLEILEVK